MLGKVLAWLTEQRQWNADHKRAWAGAAEPGPDGLSRLQRDTEAAVRALLKERGLDLVNRELVRTGGPEDYIVADVPALQAKVWIYSDQTDVETPTADLRLEEWDARTPEEHLEKVLAFLRSL